jgi:hypothetical protein
MRRKRSQRVVAMVQEAAVLQRCRWPVESPSEMMVVVASSWN